MPNGVSHAIGVSCKKRFWKNREADSMFNPTLIVIEAFIRELRTMYGRTYTILEPNYPGILSFAAGQVRELLDILTGLASFEDRALRLTMVSYS